MVELHGRSSLDDQQDNVVLSLLVLGLGLTGKAFMQFLFESSV